MRSISDSTGADYGSEPSAAAVFARLRTLVTTQAVTHAAWQSFAAAFLDPATEAFIAARLPGGGDGDDDGSRPPSKKHKSKEGAPQSESVAVVAEGKASKKCDHCGGVVPEVTLAVAMLDGTKFSVTVPERGCVREVKLEIAKVHLLSTAAGSKCHSMQ